MALVAVQGDLLFGLHLLPGFVQPDIPPPFAKGVCQPERAVHAKTGVAVLGQFLQVPGELALAVAYDRSQDIDARAFRQMAHLVHHLIHRLLTDLPPAHRAVRRAQARVEKAQIVVDLRDGSHRGAGVAGGRLLVDGDGGRKPPDVVHVRLFHEAQKLPRVGGEGLHIAPLTLRIEGVKGQGTLAAAGEPGQYHEFVPGDLQIDPLEVVFPRAADRNAIFH